MPTLNWIGKEKVVTHHLDVPFRTLDRQYVFSPSGGDDGNMIIHGDNLEALKALLPQYEGRIQLIYIDPPYNTGNEGWIYNDNVGDPRIRKWLGQVVGKEGEDLSRHDKWLCMMYPRLRLLQKLLSEDGVIFISIDDTEYASLKQVCDEIFGSNCFVSNISWQRTYSTRNDSKGIVNEVEHVLCYSKQPDWNPKKLPRTADMDSKYKNPDNDAIPWTSSDAFAAEAASHQGMVYAIQHPFSGELIYPYSNAHWRYQQNAMLEIMSGWTSYELRDIHDEEQRAHICGLSPDQVRKGVQAIMLAKPVEEARRDAEHVLIRGQWPKFYFTQNGKGGIRRKTYIDSVGGTPPTNLWLYKDTGHTDEASKEIRAIFDGRATFDTPKPVRLIEFVLRIASDPNSIILDSFAGSGTTAHAVLNMNKADGGHRRFILVEMGDYADSITAERVRRVISGYGEGKSAVEGTGGSFSYYELGAPLFVDGFLNPDGPMEGIRSYVYYSETQETIPPQQEGDPYLLGISGDTAYYFCYEKSCATVLNATTLSKLKTKAERYVIYADTCALSEEELKRLNITFKKIPRDITVL